MQITPPPDKIEHVLAGATLGSPLPHTFSTFHASSLSFHLPRDLPPPPPTGDARLRRIGWQRGVGDEQDGETTGVGRVAGERGKQEVPLSWELDLEDVADDGFGFAAGGGNDAVCCRTTITSATAHCGGTTCLCFVHGTSYYNCRPGGQANPYNHGCSAMTRCRGCSAIARCRG
ncbi:uncharacterized protein LOC123396749 [Hordeum vulgare subsp. vulgare]|uniref:uncharacterized protein LOC123396749 n=1 Tax=Hordeum vulgare subsp. vulgare TaxID=112509 RepID=UPI001D1A429D|nr:uncharacterized protein LOC123396749 [Hordeum vulgare subsp. vulgare]